MPGTWADLSVLLRWLKLQAALAQAPWQINASATSKNTPPGAEGSFSDARAVSLFIFARCPAVVVMIFISVSALFIYQFQGMLASCVWQPTSGNV